MTTRGWKKAECKRGHVAPERTKQGACVPCRKLYRAEHYQQDRAAYIDLDTGACWSWRMRSDVAHIRAAEHVAAWARDGQRVEVTK